MPKQKSKDSRITSFSLDVNVLNRMDEYSKRTYVPKTKIIEIAVTEYLNKMEKASGEENQDA